MIDITEPTLLVNKKQCLANIKKMADKAVRQNLELVPHFKTHQSAAVSRWYESFGIRACSVTSVKMARYFADNGWKKITIAFPINVLEIDAINELASKIELTLFFNSAETADILKEKLQNPVRFYVEIDVGYLRSGVPYYEEGTIQRIVETAADSLLQFSGFYTHAGHTYDVGSLDKIAEVHQQSLKRMGKLKEMYQEKYPNIKLALGDTPSCSIQEDFSGIDTIGPGNFVYYDLFQNSVGSNTINEIAICLAVPIVSIHKDRSEVVVHSGWSHHGKDSLLGEDGDPYYGLVVNIEKGKWSAPIEGAKVKKLSQEHGVLKLPKELIETVKIGDVLGVLPVHSCATALMMRSVTTLEGEKHEMMPVHY